MIPILSFLFLIGKSEFFWKESQDKKNHQKHGINESYI